MGWLTMHRGRGLTDREFFSQEFPDIEIRACATVNGTFYAAACHRRRPDEVFAVIILTRRYPKARDGYNFGYKDMDETMGPYAYGAPAFVLDALTATDNEHALAWRAACRARLAKPVPKIGQIIQLSEPVSFGGIPEIFLIRDSLPRRKNIFRTLSGRYVRFTNFRDYDYKIIPSTEAA